jgi:hypothetical protein
MPFGAWSIHPAWQNFSSLYREAQSAIEAPTDMEKSHPRWPVQIPPPVASQIPPGRTGWIMSRALC